jgi:cold shock CspA family protein
MYQVRLDIKVPGGEIAVTREPAEHVAFRDLPTALGHAFDAAVRQLQDVVRQQRVAVKHHESLPHARVARLFLDEGYGFLQTPDGRDIYFHANSVLAPTFDKLEIGTEVTFVEELGNKGPQATTIQAVGRHHHV